MLVYHTLWSQSRDNRKELRVINLLGAKVYERPTFSSNILAELPVGDVLKVETSIETTEQFEVGAGFSFPGQWIKPQGIEGYIFSSDLTNKPLEIEISEQGGTYINLLGKLLSEKNEKEIVKTQNGEFPKHLEFKYYEYGTYSYTAWDGCFGHVTEYKNLSINEVYHQMVSDYGPVPAFQEKTGTIIKFESDGATQDLKIEIRENGTMVVSSYDCT